ncbi:hypothetical protein [Lelliottia amnigena]
MNKNILILDRDIYFRLGLKTLTAHMVDHVYDFGSFKEITDMYPNSLIDILVVDPSQYDSLKLKYLMKTIRDQNSNMIAVFFIPRRYEFNYHLKKITPHVKYNRNIDCALLISLFKLILVGLTPQKSN